MHVPCYLSNHKCMLKLIMQSLVSTVQYFIFTKHFTMASAGLHGFKVYDAERYKRSDQTVFNKHPDNFQN